jgi:hypothetical protein
MRCSKKELYSITWVAAKSSVGGTAMPSNVAVCRFMASCDLVGDLSGPASILLRQELLRLFVF